MDKHSTAFPGFFREESRSRGIHLERLVPVLLGLVYQVIGRTVDDDIEGGRTRSLPGCSSGP